MPEQLPHIIIDAGSGYVKAGLSSEENPGIEFPNMIGRPSLPGHTVGEVGKNYLVGAEADAWRAKLTLKHPIHFGVVTNWEDWEIVMDYVLNSELRIDPTEHKVLLAEPPLNPAANRVKMTQYMFETFDVAGLYIAPGPVLSLYSVGEFTGLVVELGDAQTLTVPVADGNTLPEGILRSHAAGLALTVNLGRLLSEQGLQLTTSREGEILRDLKENACFVALDFDDAMARSKTGAAEGRSYKTSDGTIFHLGDACFRCPEALFQPGLMGLEDSGLAEMVCHSILQCDASLHRDLFHNIVLAGGSSLFPGLPERLAQEVRKLAPPNLAAKVKVHAPPERKYAAWIGGSILAGTFTKPKQWISRDEYNDHGPQIVRQKCF